MFKKHKSKIAATVLSILTVVFMTPTLSSNVMDIIVKRQVAESYNQQVECLAKNIYYESASEAYEGKLAVAQVTLNRVNSPQYPHDVCSVVYQKTQGTCQFSWTCNNVDTLVKNKYQWEESLLIAKRALTQPFLHDIIAKTNALYYHAVYVNPGWNKTKVVARIGNHIFYANI
jgi:spore germination cell wall hydrolase CwlJ-like protein